MPSPASLLRPALAALLLTFAFGVLPTAARAQTGPVTAAALNNWWLAPNGSIGVSLASGILTIDTDGDGLLEASDNHHPLPAAATGSANLRLSPSRTVLYASTGGRGNCTPPGAIARFFAIPATNGAPLVPIADSLCIPGGIAFMGFFDSTATGAWTQKVAFLVANSVSGQQNILWVDLNSGVTSWSSLPFTPSIESVRFTRSGIAAYVKSGANATTDANFAWVNLCSTNLGTVIAPFNTQHLVLSGPGFVSITAEVVTGAGGLEGVIHYPDPATERSRDALTDCSPPPTLGACCLPGNPNCRNSTTSGDCAALGGTWKGAGSVCATAGCPPPPAPHLDAALSGPSSANQGDVIAYVVTYGNSGSLSANSVIVQCPIPTGATFVRASAGGFGTIGLAQWNLGTLAPSAAGTCSLFVRAPCTGTSVTNTGVTIQGTPGGLVNGTGTVVTTLFAHPTTNMPMSVSSVAQAPMPLGAGAKARHTITFQNTLGVPRPGLTLSIRAGAWCTMDAVVGATAGTATISGDFLTWTGTVAAAQAVTLVFDTRVKECRPAALTPDRLNAGAALTLRNPCNVTVGFTTPADTLWLAPPPVSLALSAPALGPVQPVTGGGAIGLASGGPADVVLRVSNSADTASDPVTARVTAGGGVFPVGNPPFVGTPPATTTWDSLTKTITWTGTVPAHDSVRVTFRARVDTTGASYGTLSATGDVGACPNALAYQLSLVGLSPEPAGAHLLALSRYEGIWSHRPGVDTSKRRIVGFGSDTQTGFTRTPAGDLWVVGTPCWHANPATRVFEVLPASVLTSMDMELAFDVAWDAGDGTLVFAGYKGGRGLRVARWNPVTRVATPMWSESNSHYAITAQVKIDPQRRVVMTSGARVLWIEPATPSTIHEWPATGWGDLNALALDFDGRPLVIETVLPALTPGRAARVDLATGAFTTIGDVSALQSFGSPLTNVAVAGDSTLWTSFDYGSLVHLSRSPWGLVQVPMLGYNDDLEWVGGSGGGNVDAPESPAVHALALASPTPNPTTGPVRLAFTLPTRDAVRLSVYDLGGRRVRELAGGVFGPGPHAVTWDGRDGDGRAAPAGLYFARLETRSGSVSRRLVIAR